MKSERTRFINHLTRRTLNIGAGNYNLRLRIHLSQFHEHIKSVHAFHNEIEQHQTRFFEEVDFQRGHSVVRFHHLVTRGFENSSQASGVKARNRRRSESSGSYDLPNREGHVFQSDTLITQSGFHYH